ncbi:MAG: hypothetical protein AB2A00_27420 [Myxococcota bacterium]
MRTSLGLVALCLTVVGCGPRGNTLGLDGKYRGKFAFELISSDDPNDRYAVEYDGYVVTITRGYESDAVLITDFCDVMLKADGMKLVSDGDSECETTTTTQQDNNRDVTVSASTFSDVEAQGSPPGNLELEGEIESRSKHNDDPETRSKYKFTFSGSRVADD